MKSNCCFSGLSIKLNRVALIAMAVVLTGCGTVRTIQYTTSTSGEQSPEGLAHVFLMRNNTFKAGGVPMLAVQNTQPIGQYTAKGYLEWTTPPGKVQVRVSPVRGVFLDAQHGDFTLSMEVSKWIANEKMALASRNFVRHVRALRDQGIEFPAGEVVFNAESGKTYFILQTSHVGFTKASLDLEVVAEEQGRRVLKERDAARPLPAHLKPTLTAPLELFTD